ncbi:hypothetical protein pb186bvf_013844 [Paramecium bursaria]
MIIKSIKFYNLIKYQFFEFIRQILQQIGVINVSQQIILPQKLITKELYNKQRILFKIN